MNLGDQFPDFIKQNFAERNIDIGSAILVEIPDIQANYPKYIIIVSENQEELLLAYVVINSEINTNVFPTPYLRSQHIQIDQQNHPFLDYDSFVNCTEIKTFKRQELIDFLIENPEKAVGNINSEILRLIHITITTSRTITPYLKRKFGF